MPKNEKRLVKDQDGILKNLADLARAHNTLYTTVYGRYKNGKRTWQELTKERRVLITVPINNTMMPVSEAAKLLQITKVNVLERKRKLDANLITQQEFERVGCRYKQSTHGVPGNAEWYAMKKNPKNGDKAQQEARLKALPAGSWE